MDLRCRVGRLCWPTVLWVGLLGFLPAGWLPHSWAQSARRRAAAEPAATAARDFRSRHFLVHTDLPAAEAEELIDSLETMLRLISTYWGRPMQGVIECYVVKDLANFPTAALDATGVGEIRANGGYTAMRKFSNGNRSLAKAIVYASARPEVVHHETVHAYCHHTFGGCGPNWYSEGMAEMGHYWIAGDGAVNADAHVTRYLRESPTKSLAQTLSPFEISGDGWRNYAWRWALCHLLANNPNYSAQFQSLGMGFLTGKPVSFEQAYGPMSRELSFEYLLFLEHVCPGYRVDLCAWDWKNKSQPLRSGRPVTAGVAAARGWQPSGLTVVAETEYEYLVTGTWQTAKGRAAVDADGDREGRGRLVGVLMRDYQLGREFPLGTSGTLRLRAEGDLYLRGSLPWSELGEGSGRLAVRIRLKGQGPPLRRPDLKSTQAQPVAFRGDP